MCASKEALARLLVLVCVPTVTTVMELTHRPALVVNTEARQVEKVKQMRACRVHQAIIVKPVLQVIRGIRSNARPVIIVQRERKPLLSIPARMAITIRKLEKSAVMNVKNASQVTTAVEVIQLEIRFVLLGITVHRRRVRQPNIRAMLDTILKSWEQQVSSLFIINMQYYLQNVMLIFLSNISFFFHITIVFTDCFEGNKTI